MSQDVMKATIEKTEYSGNADLLIKATKEEVQKIKRRSDQMMGLIETMNQDLIDAKKAASQKLDHIDMIAGVAVGVTLSPAMKSAAASAAGLPQHTPSQSLGDCFHYS